APETRIEGSPQAHIAGRMLFGQRVEKRVALEPGGMVTLEPSLLVLPEPVASRERGVEGACVHAGGMPAGCVLPALLRPRSYRFLGRRLGKQPAPLRIPHEAGERDRERVTRERGAAIRRRIVRRRPPVGAELEPGEAEVPHEVEEAKAAAGAGRPPADVLVR